MPTDKPAAATPAAADWPAARVEMWAVEDVAPYARNARTHPEEQIEQIMGSMRRFGFTVPMLVAEDGTIIAGHGRFEAAVRLGLAEVPVMVARGWSDDQARAYTVADNLLAETSEWDADLLRAELEDLGILDDPALLFDIGVQDGDHLASLIGSLVAEADAAPGGPDRAAARAGLAETFGAVPFSVLNAREGWWQARKRQWLALGIRSELGRGEMAATGGSPEPLARARAGQKSAMKNGKRPAAVFGQDLMRGEGARSTGGVLMAAPSSADPAFYQQKRKVERALGREITTEEFLRDHYVAPGGSTVAATGTSIFDPVLTELLVRWFSPPGGAILDPFAGGSVRGVVAATLGRAYTGIELRGEQVAANRDQGAEICADAATPPVWIEGDSSGMDDLLTPDFAADFVMSCPPYADLEVYSDDPRDIIGMDYEDFLRVYREIVARAAARLRDDRFAAFVVGEVRGPGAGAYRNFVADTVAAFRDAGLDFYNEVILLTPAGSLPIRIAKQFRSSRKVGKTNQNVLIFCKGDPRRAAEALGEVDIDLDLAPDPGEDDDAGFALDPAAADG